MDPYRPRIRITEPEDRHGTEINISRFLRNGKNMHLEEKGWKEYRDFERWEQPTLFLEGIDHKEILQGLVDELRAIGYIAQEGKSVVNDLQKTIAAKDAHISDLQTVLGAFVKGKK